MKLLTDFDERAWATAEALLENKPDLVKAFKTWLEFPESQARIEQDYGAEWTLEQAVKMMLPNRKPGKPILAVGSRKRAGPGREIKRGPYRVGVQGDPDEEMEEPEEDEPPETALPAIDTKQFQQLVKERIAVYVRSYSDITPNDQAVIDDLAAREVEMDVLHQMLREVMSGEQDKATAGKIASLNYALKKNSEEVRALQKHLHIDRLSREKEAEKMGAADEAAEVIDLAGEFVEKWVVKIIHTGCQVSGVIGKSDILFFEVVRGAFPEVGFDFTFICPRCMQKVEFHYRPTADEIAAAREPAWVAEHEAEYNAKDMELKRGEMLKELEEGDDSKEDE